MRDFKQEIIEKISSNLKEMAKEIHEDPTASVEDQLTQMNVIFDIMKYLSTYNESNQVLEDYRKRKDEIRRIMKYGNIPE